MSAGDQPGDVWNRDSGMAPDCEVEGGVAAPIDTRHALLVRGPVKSGCVLIQGRTERSSWRV